MFRVGKQRKIVVLAPQAWFPGQALIRRFRPHFRPPAPRFEVMAGVEVHRPRYLSLPGVLKRLDGISMGLCSLRTARRLVRDFKLNILDVHFAYPAGRAGAFLAPRLGLPMVLTLRGKEKRESYGNLRGSLTRAITTARRVITVSNDLRDLAVELGAHRSRVHVVGNGIDVAKFSPIPQAQARTRLGLGADWQILVSVGGLVKRKGFQRVIGVLPALLREFSRLHFVIVGGAGPEGDDSLEFKTMASGLGLADRVHFFGPKPPEQLFEVLSAADVFVLASSYEGWANVLLEAMACGLPVVATDVGGNSQVVNNEKLGFLTALGDAEALAKAIERALCSPWDRNEIRAYAQANAWDRRIPLLLEIFDAVLSETNNCRIPTAVAAVPGGHGVG